MLSIANITAKHASNYYSNVDYYTKDSVIGEWYGKIAEKLELNKKLFQKEDFENLLNGKLMDKSSNKEIKLNVRSNRACGIDLTFSAPKSVSIVCELQDNNIEKIHLKAVKDTLSYIEDNFIFSRTKDEYKKENKLIATLFTHNTSRELDPQLHTHCVLHNLVCNESNGNKNKFKTAYFKDIFNNKKFIGSIYRNELAKGLEKAGYEIEFDKNKFSFEIKGASKELIKIFSTRRQQIEEKLKDSTSQNIDGRISAKATLLTRKAKEKNINVTSLKQEWKNKAINYNLNDLNKMNTLNKVNILSEINILNNDLKNIVQNAFDHISERKAVFTKQEIIQIIEKTSFGKFSIKEIEQAVKNQHNIFYNVQTREFTTMQQYVKEETIINLTKQNQNTLSKTIPFNKLNSIKNNTKLLYNNLTQEQQKAVDFILTNKDQFVAIQGYAGVGKTYTIKALNEILTKNNYKLLGLAPTNNATNILKKEADIKTNTLQGFLLKYDGYANNRGTEQGLKQVREEYKNTIILLDESSLADTKQIKDLFTIADKLKIRVILQGDKMQLDSINAGTPFKQLQDKNINTTELSNIQRQKDINLKNAVYDVINKDIKDAFTKLEQNKHIIDLNNAKTNDLKQSIIDTTVKEYLKLNKEQRQNTLILAPANETRIAVNTILREELRKEYNLQNSNKENSIFNKIKSTFIKKELTDTNINILQQKSLTEVEKKDISNYELNNKLIFIKDQKIYNIEKQKEYNIIDIDAKNNTLTIQNEERKTIQINLNKAKDFNIFETKNLPLQKYENLKWTKTLKENGIFKSNELQLTKITDKDLTFKEITTNREITLKYNDPLLKNLDYNYTTTTYSAQGKTTKNAIVVLESYRTNLTNQKSFYVELSRVKNDITIITDNKDKALSQLIKNTGEKVGAMDIADKQRTMESVEKRMVVGVGKEMEIEK